MKSHIIINNNARQLKKCPSCGTFHQFLEKDQNKACEFCRRKGQTEWTVMMARVATKKWWR